jgi:DNA-binding transcriptional MerR regulator
LASDSKSAAAFRTIGEVAQATGLAPHILRYWESRFPQLRPITRAGSRRYYRPEDVALIERIDRLLNHEGYTIKGVQQVLARDPASPAIAARAAAPPPPPRPAAPLAAIRKLLADALDAD